MDEVEPVDPVDPVEPVEPVDDVRAAYFSRPMPPGRALDLPGRGTTWIHEAGREHATPDRPAVVLLHGWTATAELNWFTAMPFLADTHHVVAVEHRGHGRGLRSDEPFRLTDCADDVAAVAETLDLGPVVAVGYSMGGPIAQLLWRRHGERVAGLVLCATAARFDPGPAAGALAAGLAGVVGAAARRLSPEVRSAITARALSPKYSPDEPGGRIGLAVAGSHELRDLAEALAQVTSYRADWLDEVDVPTAVVLTSRDRTVPPQRQRDLHAAIPGASLHVVEGDHTVCAIRPDRFVPVAVDAVERVSRRAQARPPQPTRPAR